jgi:hypothetical protein
LKEIGKYAFGSSGFKAIRIPNSVESIGRCCVYGCKSVCEFVFESDSKLNKIGDFAFSHSRVKTIEIPDKCELLTGKSLNVLEFVTVSNRHKSLVPRNKDLKHLAIIH